MATFISRSPAETENLAERLGREAAPGTVFGLAGELGSGKTQFVRGLARGLGCKDRVHSPTFAIVHVYAGGRLPLFHLDLYRLDTDAQRQSAGLEEYFTPNGISAIEWADRWPEAKPPQYRLVTFKILSETERQIDYDSARP